MRLIDADFLMRSFQVDMCGSFTCHECPLWNKDGECGFEVLISDTPTVDAVPVVRCKDCKRGKPDTICDDYTACEYRQTIMPNSGFCSYGERKDVIQK